jgi:hypothetical protein
MYDIHMHFDSFNITISDGLNITTFNINTQKITHIVCVWGSFLSNFYISKQSTNYNSTFSWTLLIIILGDLSVDIL